MAKPIEAATGRLQQVVSAWQQTSLRTKLTGASAAAAMVAILGVVAIAYIAVHHEQFKQVDNNLRHQAQDVHLIVVPIGNGQYEVSAPRQPGEISGYVQVVSAEGGAAGAEGGSAVLPVKQRDVNVAARGGSWLRTATIDGVDMRILTAPSRIPHVAVQIALPLGDVERQLHTLAWAFLALATIGVLLAFGAARLLVRRTMRPVAVLTDAAERVAITHDLSLRMTTKGADEIARLATSFNTMLDALQQALQAQRQLVMDASHELRTPLASLRTNVEVLHQVERLTPMQRGALLKDIVTQLEELTGLVSDVVELAKGDAPDATAEPFQFADLVVTAVDRARRHWPMISFEVTVEPVVIRAVPSRIDRAVANLLDNAAKFSPPGGDVDVTLTADGRLTVADRGPGIPAQALPHVFQRFYRADEARALPGSGLGLAIVQQIAVGNGGTVTIGNRDGRGAIAQLALPPLPADAEQTPRPSDHAVD